MENNLNLNQHISQKFNADLDYLREQVSKMGGMVEKQLSNSLQCLVNADLEMAKEVINGDTDINKLELEISHKCNEVLALRQPSASDLRLILAVVKIITDLERIGDLSQKMGALSKKLIKKGMSNRYYSELRNLGRQVETMLSNCLDAFARLDAEGAMQVMDQEEQIDSESDALSRQLITYMMEDPRSIKHTLRVLNVAKSLERIGDHCENICEHTVYVVSGEDIRYQNIDDVRRAMAKDDDLDLDISH